MFTTRGPELYFSPCRYYSVLSLLSYVLLLLCIYYQIKISLKRELFTYFCIRYKVTIDGFINYLILISRREVVEHPESLQARFHHYPAIYI